MITVIFSHGRGSSAQGKKITQLAHIAADYGYQPYCVNDVDCNDPEQRAKRLITLVKTYNTPLVLVGSSMGGYTSLLAAPYCSDLRGVFLIAPALYIAGYQQQDFQRHFSVPVDIVHGWQDEVIPWQNTLRYGQNTAATLHFLAGDHRLHQQQTEINACFSHFLDKVDHHSQS